MPDIPVTMPLGGYDGTRSASDQLPGTYGAGCNVRSIDPRSKRARLSRRPGLTALSDDPVVVEGDEVTALFRIGRDTVDDRYRLLTETVQDGVTPGSASIAWERTLPSQPLAIAAGPDGRLAYVVMDSGAVAVVNAKGDITETIPSRRPVNFQTIDAIAVDEQGGVFVGYAFGVQVDGRAGELVRMVKSERGDWETGYTAPLESTLVHFTYRASVLYVAVQRPENEEDLFESAVVRLTGATTSVPVQSWIKQVAHPVIRLAVNEQGDVFVASLPNPDRPVASTTAIGTPSVSWTPMEPVAAVAPVPSEELYWWTSAERAATVQGLYNGQRVSNWVESRRDPSDWPAVIDVLPTSSVIGRGFVHFVDSLGAVQLGPDMDADAAGNGDKPGIYFDGIEASMRRLTTRSSYGSHEKAAPDGQAPHQRAILPTMWDGGANLGATYVTTWAVRVRNWSGGVAAAADDKVIFQQGTTRLVYYESGSVPGELEVEFTHAGVTRSLTLTGTVHTDFNTLVFTFLHAGIGATTSQCWVNGLQMGADMTIAANGDGARTVIGGPNTDAGSSVNGWGMRGWIFEVVTMLGSTVTVPHDTAPNDDTREYLEGFCAHRYGLQSALDPGHTYSGAPPIETGDTQLNEGGFGVSEQTGLLVKYSSAGEPRWWVGGGNCGNGVVCGPDGRVYSCGTPLPSGTGPSPRLTMLLDMGDTVVASGPTTWTLSFERTDQWARAGVDLRLDDYGNVYLPFAMAGSGATREFRRYKRDGLLPASPFSSLDWSLEMNTDADTDEVPIAVAGIGLPIEVGAVTGWEAVWAISRDDEFQIRRIDTIGTLDAPRASSRDVALLSVTSSGAVRRLGTGGVWTPMIAGAFTGVRPWIATVYPYSVIGDGVNPYRVLDHRSMQLREFEASTKGEVPARSPIGWAWRRRVGVVNPTARHQLAYSAFGDVFDWDPGRTLVTATQAVTSKFSAAADFPDLIRNVIPWNDDLALVMLDGSIWRQTGDPMTGGQQDQLVPDLGLADDWAWARDTQGAAYFLATDRRVWRIAPDGQREPITAGTIWALMQDIDLARFRVEMEWSVREDALWVFVLPRTGSPVELEHYVWERAANAWHPQRFDGGPGRVVTAVGSFDGDGPDDVATLLGFADGRVRRVDQYAIDDAGVPVGSHVTIGPLVGGQSGIEAHMVALDVTLAVDGGAVSIGARGSNFADAPGSVRRFSDVPVGRRARLPLNLRAPHVWVDIVGRDGLPWSLEEMSLNVAGGGQRKMR